MPSPTTLLPPLTPTQRRVERVLGRLRDTALDSDDTSQRLAELLEPLLCTMHAEDAFGTEGQADPRGDFREGVWSMGCVQGVDG